VKPPRRATRWLLRAIVGAFLFLMLGGPTPGDVGGCGAKNEIASPVDHCSNTEFWKCQRDHFVGRITDPEYDMCLGRIEATCAAAAWPPGCQPTPAQSDACIQLLRRSDLVDLTTEELLAMYPDCNLCM
jgi:hypothetical protein